mmetsp:Transcript_21213/g.36457  ORF Transcript_21213/g.36457 Transcript_21213/m.36457 type:complete len:108 (-) Transcript_21213:719-1042(-)
MFCWMFGVWCLVLKGWGKVYPHRERRRNGFVGTGMGWQVDSFVIVMAMDMDEFHAHEQMIEFRLGSKRSGEGRNLYLSGSVKAGTTSNLVQKRIMNSAVSIQMEAKI